MTGDLSGTSTVIGTTEGRATIDRPAAVATVVSVAVVSTVLLIELVLPGGWGQGAWAVLVAGLLAGLPHGAVDHLLPSFRLGPSRGRLLVVLLGYAGVAVLTYLLFQAASGTALVVFVVVSLWHFGTGETAFAAVRAGRPAAVDPLAATIHGCVVLVLPLAARPDEVAPVIAALVPGSSGALPETGCRIVAIVVLTAGSGAALHMLRQGRLLEASELGLLVAAMLVLSPLAAFGAYFGGWHAVRHLARLLHEDPRNTPDLIRGRLARPLLRFARSAFLPTLISLIALALLWDLADGWRDLVAAHLALLAALTVPHMVTVAWLDRSHRSAVAIDRAGTSGRRPHAP